MTTNKNGDYSLKVKTTTTGVKKITATYDGNNYYKNDYDFTNFEVNKKISVITVGSTSNVNVGESASIYGKLSVRGIGLANTEVKLNIDGTNYYTTTNKYGDYTFSYRADYIA